MGTQSLNMLPDADVHDRTRWTKWIHLYYIVALASTCAFMAEISARLPNFPRERGLAECQIKYNSLFRWHSLDLYNTRSASAAESVHARYKTQRLFETVNRPRLINLLHFADLPRLCLPFRFDCSALPCQQSFGGYTSSFCQLDILDCW
jgi:hypothetical protein